MACIPSDDCLEEDFGIVPVESLSCGTPVIAYGKGGVTESVIDGKHGVLFEYQHEESLIDAIERFESKSEFGTFVPSDLHARSLEFSSERLVGMVRETVEQWLQLDTPTKPKEPSVSEKIATSG